jgi:hypothetical protein
LVIKKRVSFTWVTHLDFNGGASRVRTDYLVTASDALSQMSYSPHYHG